MGYDAIIIGAGMSGLAAGIRLAMFGKRTLILERHYLPGGLNGYYHRHRRAFDVGLHAMTNYVPRGAKRAPLTKLLRQLRIPYEAFALREQHGSEVRFPGARLRFGNDFELLRAEVRRAFPDQIDGFDRLTKLIDDYDDLSLDAAPVDSRPVIEELITDPLLVEMLYCPLMYYGSAQVNAMEMGQYCIMFKALFKEGFARPEGGVRTVISALVDKFLELGGELRYQRGVERILTHEGRVRGVLLEAVRGVTKSAKRNTTAKPAPRPLEGGGEVIEAPVVLSTIGYPETLARADGLPPLPADEAPIGSMSFMESIMVLDAEPRDLGIDQTIIFYNDSPRFDYRPPDDFADVRSGVICAPNNYHHQAPLPEGLLRVTSIANYDRWAALAKPEPYADVKAAWYRRQQEKLVEMLGDFRPHVVCDDVFTPTTVRFYTGHLKGAIYGSPKKVKSGLTPIEGLYLAGTDQGFLGIVGAMLSGISIANARVLQAGA